MELPPTDSMPAFHDFAKRDSEDGDLSVTSEKCQSPVKQNHEGYAETPHLRPKTDGHMIPPIYATVGLIYPTYCKILSGGAPTPRHFGRPRPDIRSHSLIPGGLKKRLVGSLMGRGSHAERFLQFCGFSSPKVKMVY